MARHTTSLPDIPLTTIDARRTTFAEYAGNVVLVVNVASKCGHTPQYAALEQLQKTYSSRGFTVLGFPCNQFMMQESGSAESIAEFCNTTYAVDFPLFEKTRVNGRSQHPLYEQLTRMPDANGAAGRVKWNFEKFLIAPSGEMHRSRSAVKPGAPEVVQSIEAALSQHGR
ncbi:MAG: glutathione peroxidase [Terrimesophilobacter sp.]